MIVPEIMGIILFTRRRASHLVQAFVLDLSFIYKTKFAFLIKSRLIIESEKIQNILIISPALHVKKNAVMLTV